MILGEMGWEGSGEGGDEENKSDWDHYWISEKPRMQKVLDSVLVPLGDREEKYSIVWL